MYCEYDGKTAEFQCTECGRTLCAHCVDAMHLAGEPVMICPACKGRVQAIDDGPRNLSEKNFWYYVSRAWFWPLSGRGLLVLLINAVFFALILAVSAFAIIFFVGILGVIVAYGYLYLLFLTVIQQTAMGDAEPPTTPAVEDVGDLFGSLWRVLVLFAVWTTPAVVVSHVVNGEPEGWIGGTVLALSGPAALLAFIGGPEQAAVVRVVAGLGALFLPMSLLAVASFRSLRGLHPVPLAITISRAPLQYIVCCVFFYLVVLARGGLFGLDQITGVPFVDPLIRSVVLVYSLYAVGRMLGGLHAANSVRFGWVR